MLGNLCSVQAMLRGAGWKGLARVRLLPGPCRVTSVGRYDICIDARQTTVGLGYSPPGWRLDTWGVDSISGGGERARAILQWVAWVGMTQSDRVGCPF